MAQLVVGKPHNRFTVEKHRLVIAQLLAQILVPAEIAGFRAIDIEALFQ